MLNKPNIHNKIQIRIIYIFLVALTLAVYSQVNHFDFVDIDDNIYVTENYHISSGKMLDRLSWMFNTIHAEFWHPLTWISLICDNQLYGLNAGGYHVSNLIFHILSTLLFFWFFNHTTGATWKSAFVAAFFALHPLHVESVAWVAERKDVLSVFLWIVTLCLYVFYTKKITITKYLLVLFSFTCALMSKPMVVTLPVIMILLDYWPLRRFESQKGNLMLWQLWEKTPFFILSTVFSIITVYAQHGPYGIYYPFSTSSRIANALVSYMTYLKMTFWPVNLTFFYPFSVEISSWQVMGSSLLIIFISAISLVLIKRLPYLFIGWMWYAITIAPVIGIIQINQQALADRYHYLPSIGIAVMMAWGIPALIKRAARRKIIIFPVAIVFLTIMSILTWKQCSYWKSNFILFNHALLVSKNNYVAYNSRGVTYGKMGQYDLAIEDFNKAINIKANYAEAYFNRGVAYNKRSQYYQAVEEYNKAIHIMPDYVQAYYNRGEVHSKLGQYQKAIEDYDKAIYFNPDGPDAYINRGIAYGEMGQHRRAIDDFHRAIRIRPDYISFLNNRGSACSNRGQYQEAILYYDEAIRLEPNNPLFYNNRGAAYLTQGNVRLGCRDAQKACGLGNCTTLKIAKSRKDCH